MGKIAKRKSISERGGMSDCFVGREALIESFWKDYNASVSESDDWNAYVINYFGMPGIGKTELANQLNNQLIEKNKKVFSFLFKPEDSFLDNMLDFRRGIGNCLDVHFPLFDLAIMSYFKRSGRVIDEEKKKYLLDNDIADVVFPLMSIHPVTNIVAAVLQALRPLEKKYKRTFSEEDFCFLKESPTTIFNKLPHYFMMDLYKVVENAKEPLTVLLDDVEFFKGKYDFEEWFLGEKGIFREIPNIIWCIFSQKELQDKLEQEDKVIRKIELGALQENDIKLYLDSVGINPDYHHTIIIISEGMPLYLSIICEIYFIKVSQKKLDEFDASLGKNRVIDWYFKELDKDYQTILMALAFIESWNDEEAMNVIGDLGISVEKYWEIIEHSYVRKGNGRYYFHSVIQDALSENMPSELLKRLNTILSGKSVFEFAEVKATISDIDNIAAMNDYIVSLIGLLEKLRSSMEIDRMYKLHRIITLGAQRCQGVVWAESISYYIYGRLLSEVGLPEQAYDLLSAAMRIISSSTRPSNLDQKNCKMLEMQIRDEYAQTLQQTHSADEASKIRKKLLEETIKINGEKSIEAIAAKQNYYAGQLSVEGKLDEGINGLNKVIRKRKKYRFKNPEDENLNKESTIYALTNLALGYLKKEALDEAYDNARIAYRMACDIQELDSCSVLDTTLVLERILLEAGCYEEVVDDLEKLYLRFKAKLPKHSEIMLSIRYSLGIAYVENKQFDEAIDILKENFQMSFDLYGMSHKQTLKNKKEYALCLAKKGDHDNAIELLEDCRETYVNVYGYDSSEQLRNLLQALIVECSLTNDEEKKTELVKLYKENDYPLGYIKFALD